MRADSDCRSEATEMLVFVLYVCTPNQISAFKTWIALKFDTGHHTDKEIRALDCHGKYISTHNKIH